MNRRVLGAMLFLIILLGLVIYTQQKDKIALNLVDEHSVSFRPLPLIIQINEDFSLESKEKDAEFSDLSGTPHKGELCIWKCSKKRSIIYINHARKEDNNVWANTQMPLNTEVEYFGEVRLYKTSKTVPLAEDNFYTIERWSYFGAVDRIFVEVVTSKNYSSEKPPITILSSGDVDET